MKNKLEEHQLSLVLISTCFTFMCLLLKYFHHINLAMSNVGIVLLITWGMVILSIIANIVVANSKTCLFIITVVSPHVFLFKGEMDELFGNILIGVCWLSLAGILIGEIKKWLHAQNDAHWDYGRWYINICLY